MPETQEPTKGAGHNLTVVKNYFGNVSSRELIDLKKAEPGAIKQLAEGIENGTLTY